MPRKKLVTEIIQISISFKLLISDNVPTDTT